MKVLGLIPARGNSKRVPRKNIIKVNGIPLIAHTIMLAKKSNLFDRIIVSTDDSEIAEISKSYGAEVPFIRPVELALDETPDQPVFQHALSKMKSLFDYEPEIILNLRPTSPLRTVNTIKRVINSFDKSIDIVRTMNLSSGVNHPYWMYTLNRDGLANQFLEDINIEKFYQSQLLPDVYRINGVVDGYRREVIENGSMLSGNLKGVTISEEEAQDIDTMLDLKICELLLKDRNC